MRSKVHASKAGEIINIVRDMPHYAERSQRIRKRHSAYTESDQDPTHVSREMTRRKPAFNAADRGARTQ